MIPAKHAHLRVSARTDQGKKGKNNEDLFSVTAYRVSALNPTPVTFAIVADGIGGHMAGEVAAEIAVEMVTEAVAQSDASQPTAIMQAAIMQASDVIQARAVAAEQAKKMGTTVVCAWIIGKNLYLASVGNSRIYLLRNRKMIQVNKDHTWVQEAVDAGALTPEQARKHPHANVIRRYLGSRERVDVDLRLRIHPNDSDVTAVKNQGTQLRPGDRLLLCSDGLNDMVEDAEIRKVALGKDLNKAVKRLVRRANEMGGKDNITVVLLEMPETIGVYIPRFDINNPRHRLTAILGGSVAGTILLIALGWFGWQAYFGAGPAPIQTAIPPTVTQTSTPTITPTLASTPSNTAVPNVSPDDHMPTDTLSSLSP
jgi:protein phosphatase